MSTVMGTRIYPLSR